MGNASQQREPYQSRRDGRDSRGDSRGNDRDSYQNGQTTRIDPTKPEELLPFLEANKALIDESIAECARGYMTADGLIHTLTTEAQFKTDFYRAPKEAFLYALVMQARTGLRTGTTFKEAFFSSKYLKDFGCHWVCFEPMVAGLQVLIRRSGRVRDSEARVVYDGDEFDYAYGLNQRIEHKPAKTRKQPEKLTHTYVIFHFADGSRPHFAVLDANDVARHQNASLTASRGDSPWKVHTGEMWKKSAVRSEAKHLEISDEFKAAIEALDEADTGRLEFLRAVLPGFDLKALPPSSAEEVGAPTNIRDRIAARAAAVGAPPVQPPAPPTAVAPAAPPPAAAPEQEPSPVPPAGPPPAVNHEQLARLQDGAHTPEVAAAIAAQAPQVQPPSAPDSNAFIEPAQARHLSTSADRWKLTDAEVNEVCGWLGVAEFAVIPRRLHARATMLLEIRHLLIRRRSTMDKAVQHYKKQAVNQLTDDEIKACLGQLRLMVSRDAQTQTRS